MCDAGRGSDLQMVYGQPEGRLRLSKGQEALYPDQLGASML